MIDMSQEHRPANVAKLVLTASVAQKRIRAASSKTDNVVFGIHASERMDEREILDVDVLRALREGHVDDAPEPAQEGEWKCKVTRHSRGSRTVGVVVILLRSGKVFVKTVEWEDLL
jgi:hypothetical protein